MIILDLNGVTSGIKCLGDCGGRRWRDGFCVGVGNEVGG